MTDPTTNTLNTSAMQIVQIHHYSMGVNSSEVDKLYQDDAVWIITSSFIIFTMHSGFGLLESGSVSAKDEVNIMVKNVVDVVFGGLSYWSVGYGLSFGDYEPFRNSFIGFGRFFYDPTRDVTSVNEEGWAYAAFLFQLSLATTASTIVSGAVAERAKLKSYILLGCLVILIQALPAHWVWDSEGFFFKMGVVDFAGCSAVHMVGGIIGLIATVYLKPRRNRFNEDSVHQMSSPTNALLGTFLLWWGWFGINAGSVWGITSGRWRLGARAAVATIMSSIGGGVTSIVISFAKTKKLQVNFLINGILSSIVSITALCAVSRPWHALIIGGVSAGFSISVLPLLERLKVDDPVGIVPIHLTSSIWGMAAVGIFCERDRHLFGATNGHAGLLYSGSFTLLGVQLLCTVTILVYSAAFGLLALVLISKSPLGLRVTDYEEQIGADVIEHGLAGTNVARYVLEKPLSTRTFQTVTKAITKWKMLAKTKSRSKRMEQARQRRLTEEQAFTSTDGTTTVKGANGVPLTGNGAIHRRRALSSVPDGAAGISPRANGGIRQNRNNIDVEAQAHTPQSKGSSLKSASPRRASSPAPGRLGSSGKSTSLNSPRRTESIDGEGVDSQMSQPSTSNTGSETRPVERPITASHIGMTVGPSRHNPVGKFVRSPPARALTPPDDISMDSEHEPSISAGSLGRNNKVAPQ
nr:Ammonium transporter domain containing protein [Haemonchus contortus]